MTAPLLDHAFPVPLGEEARVGALHAFDVLDQPQQEDLDAAVRLAAYV